MVSGFFHKIIITATKAGKQKKIFRPFAFTLIIFWICGCNLLQAQCITHNQFEDSLLNIENAGRDKAIKLKEIIALKDQYVKCGFEKDSLYARMFHRIGAWEYATAYQVEHAIKDTRLAVSINISGKKNASPSFAAVSYKNLGFYYLQLSGYNEALIYYDSAAILFKKYTGDAEDVSFCRLQRGNIFFKKGDYQKDVEETTIGLKIAMAASDTLDIIDLLNERGQAYEKLNSYEYALNDVNTALNYLKGSDNYGAFANAYKVMGNIMADKGDFLKLKYYYSLAIQYREKTEDPESIAGDYNDGGYMFYFKGKNVGEANKYYRKAYDISSAADISFVSMVACMNIAQVYFDQQQYSAALAKTQQSILLLANHFHSDDVLKNPSHKDILSLDTKSYMGILLYNKSECLLYLYKQTRDKKFLASSIATALLADSVITDMRHEQTGEQSKLYWTNYARPFYTNALEACWLANDTSLAFFFMEKSRAVLLNDQMNQLGAAAKLPPAEAAQQEAYQINIIEQQQNLSSLDESSAAYASLQVKLLQAKDDFEHYIKTLEQKYPLYYQYKYADAVPSLQTVQQYLAAGKQSFIHYFINDTVSYILAITPSGTKLTRHSQQDFKSQQLTDFLRLCADKQALNNHYSDFGVLSNSIYKALFQPLQIPKGRVIICADNFLIPFEALTTDTEGKHFLIYDYTFSYVYSARYLMNRFNSYPAKGNFLGIAPVSFAGYLQLPDLKQSAKALNASATYYGSTRLLTDKEANTHNFLQELPKYTIANIFSHARADSTDNEPLLFMADSAIHLMQLQLINDPATRLVVLSACETNVGEHATGEGIYSLARGFAAAGIPSVSATLWKADEATIYGITELFNKNLSLGMNKDEALQQAKLSYMKNNGNEKMLPYYWANMVLAGNTAPLTLSADNHLWWWIGGIGIGVIIIALVMARRRAATNRKKI